MKTKMRPRYYCDHCKKASGSPSAMRRHEPSCTKNPNRICKVCGILNGGNGYLIEGTVAFMDPVRGNDWQARMEALREATENCPCCILAVIRQTGATTPEPASMEDPGGYPEGMHWNDCIGAHALLGFNFKEELKSKMADINAARAEDASYY